jgi:toxin CptA
MRNAPSVKYPVGRSAFCAHLMLGIAGLGLLGVVLGAGYGALPPGWVGGVAWCAWSTAAMWAWWRQPRGQLVWEADLARPDDPLGMPGAWFWVGGARLEGVALKQVERVYDLQSTMLLRLSHNGGAGSWIWVDRSADPVRWLDLRRALMAHG